MDYDEIYAIFEKPVHLEILDKGVVVAFSVFRGDFIEYRVSVKGI